MTPNWIYLKDPVPQVVANRAAQLLKTPGLRIGMAWVEQTFAPTASGVWLPVECSTRSPGIASTMLRYTCEDHGHGVTGISVYGLV